jgi:hypothetical protein
MFKQSTLQPPNPDRASDWTTGTIPYKVSKWPLGTNPNRGREQPMRTDPIALLSGLQVAEGKIQHGSRHDRRGPHFTHHTILEPPPIKGRMERGLRNPLERH